MSYTLEERCELYPLEEIAVNALYEYYSDLGDLQNMCDDMKILCEKEQITTSGSDKYGKLIEDEAFLIEDIAKLSNEMLVKHKNVIDAFRTCRAVRELKRKDFTKPKKK
ncbi:hypothetical protein EDI_113960 [Entamoeba dispar SAW760]|uniref:Uncharacterized protein n=1 Tax=Entamoeba dispar (strain ATCC PRA-260 / SAW760) TaxID=370354 RepID=B0EEW3_ENTDS|nr:uncharacterized protein EDI_113960 [Entamoeba dispar SAW760]EDR26939.1 hypothetical protein EDI_113960 [Entamoeba dispar SAW760]|eukprot:EDR26939.1 hypothetical protein EDI_113960 [Entamoeba dispar SAW760]